MNKSAITFEYTKVNENGETQLVQVELVTGGEEFEKLIYSLAEKAENNKNKTASVASGCITVTLKGESYVDKRQLKLYEKNEDILN